MGCGDYSTPVLSAIARSRGSRFVVHTSDQVWANKFYKYAEIEIVDWVAYVPHGTWGLVMLDNDQYTCDRIKLIPNLSKICKKIVMHDADAAMLSPDYSDLTEGLKSTMYAQHTPWTVVLEC